MTKKKISFGILIFLLSAATVLCGYKIYSELYARNREKQDFKKIVSLVTADEKMTAKLRISRTQNRNEILKHYSVKTATV